MDTSASSRCRPFFPAAPAVRDSAGVVAAAAVVRRWRRGSVNGDGGWGRRGRRAVVSVAASSAVSGVACRAARSGERMVEVVVDGSSWGWRSVGPQRVARARAASTVYGQQAGVCRLCVRRAKAWCLVG